MSDATHQDHPENAPTAVGRPHGYAMAIIDRVEPGPDLWRYMESVEETFAPFGGWWCIHGTSARVVEGDWPGDVVLVGFPSPDAAAAWYRSPEYRAILPLRTAHSSAAVALLDGVPDGYEAASTVAAMKSATAAPRS